MPKSSAGGLFGSRSGIGGAVTVVEVSVARSSARRALIVFWVVSLAGIGVGLVAAALFDRYQPVVYVLLGIVAGVVAGYVAAAAVRVWPVLRVVWHWLPEVTVTAAVVVGWLALASAASPLVALLVLVTVAGLVASVGPSRRWVVMAAWCVIVRHRLRLCFAEFIRTPTKTNAGSAPLILAAKPTPAGERVCVCVCVWLRPGLDLSDLEGRIGKLAVACWAKEVRVVHASRRFAALIRVDVARRDPLVGRVDSPLSVLIPDSFTTDAPMSSGRVPVALDLADVPDSLDDAPVGGRPDRVSRSAQRDRKVPEQRANEYDAYI
jgi:hypothetical protein